MFLNKTIGLLLNYNPVYRQLTHFKDIGLLLILWLFQLVEYLWMCWTLIAAPDNDVIS